MDESSHCSAVTATEPSCQRTFFCIAWIKTTMGIYRNFSTSKSFNNAVFLQRSLLNMSSGPPRPPTREALKSLIAAKLDEIAVLYNNVRDHQAAVEVVRANALTAYRLRGVAMKAAVPPVAIVNDPPADIPVVADFTELIPIAPNLDTDGIPVLETYLNDLEAYRAALDAHDGLIQANETALLPYVTNIQIWT